MVYWATPKVEETLEANKWPGVYCDRNEIQEHRFKDTIAHGVLDINDSRKTLMSADRHYQRKKKALDRSLETARQRATTKAEA